MTAADEALPPGEWVTNRDGTRRYQPLPDPEPMRQIQEQTILHILLTTRQRERQAITELRRIIHRTPHQKAV